MPSVQNARRLWVQLPSRLACQHGIQPSSRLACGTDGMKLIPLPSVQNARRLQVQLPRRLADGTDGKKPGTDAKQTEKNL